MKMTIKGMTRVLGALALCLALCLSQAAFAKGSPPDGIDPDDLGKCEINNGGWDHTPGSTGISLRSALWYANKIDGQHYACYDKITLMTDVFMESPAVILGPAKGLEIDGNGKTINLSKWSGHTATDGNSGHGCAIYVSAEEVTIKNLSISGKSGINHSGICLKKKDGKIEEISISDMDNDGVKISGTKSEASNIDIYDSGNGIAVEAEGVKLTDVEINNVDGAGVRLLGNNARLSDIEVNSAGETGLEFGPGVTGNKVLPNCTFQASTDSGVGILDDSSKSNAGTNIVIMTNRVGSVDNDGYDAVTDEGILIWEEEEYYSVNQMLGDLSGVSDPAGTSKIDISVTAELLLKSNKEVVPLVTEVRQIGTSQRYMVEGFFAQVEELDEDGEGGFDQIQCKDLVVDKSVARLAVFMVSDTEMKFAGVVGNNSAMGVKGKEGTFKFYFDPEADGQEAFTGAKFVLVPVSKDWELMGRASAYKRLTNGQNDCTDISGSGEDYDTDGATTWSMDKLVEWFTVGECSIATDMQSGQMVDTTTDSDMDGIPDFLEMGIRKKAGKWVYDPMHANCNCDDTELTCWFRPDSDFDGIKDGKDRYDFLTAWKFYASKDYLDDTYNDEFGTLVGEKGIELKPQPTDTEGDGTPDCKDEDSDNDSLKDGTEDRSRVFNPYARAYWRYLDTIGNTYYPAGPGEADAGSMVECTDELKADPNNGFDKGIMYGIYVAGGTGSNYLSEPVSASPFNIGGILTSGSGRGLYPMACINESVSSATNFNGIYNEVNGETNARNADTDGDCVCDGDGPGCAAIDAQETDWVGFASCSEYHSSALTMSNPAWLNDRCPQRMHPDNKCTPLCVEGEIMTYVSLHADEKFWEQVGTKIQLTDEDGNSVPDLFEQTMKFCGDDPDDCIDVIDYQVIHDSCSDIDRDGIPDCAERWSWSCTPTQEQTIGLDPYNQDTDGDDLIDGMGLGDMESDVCPFTNKVAMGYSDAFNEVNPNYSCNPREVYSNGGRPLQVLSCFLDRDSEGVRDCLEDKDQNGKVDTPQNGLAGIVRSESDPIKLDTDADGLSDFEEVFGWPYRTNPALIDTDGDGLTDLGEDMDGDRYITFVDRTGMMCKGIGTFDTDPRNADTDGDGISDKVEIDGDIIDPDLFKAMLQDATIWVDGIGHGSDPNAKDSDNDGLTDSEEYGGNSIFFYNSNPCMVDSDGDIMHDKDELPGCRLNTDPNCIGSEDGTADGLDSDSDGLSDLHEMMLGTDPYNPDTDGDGVWDGIEDGNRNGVYEPHLGETNALNSDTDGDSLTDGYELRYGTDPTNIDTDGDCVPDGIEDANRNGVYDVGAETNALSWDTDGDGLPDGWIAGMGLGEDLNCNGIRDVDAEGRYLETDPRNPDSDLDGFSDYDEMIHGGRGFSTENISRATLGREGCSMVGSAGGSPTSMFYLMGVLLAAVKAIAMRRRNASA
ncbi:MAG: hypothetical protein JXA24_06995 [Proteobacteria bacterium]|nr:hypothetical protein [Pseudomonadota bacterium]